LLDLRGQLVTAPAAGSPCWQFTLGWPRDGQVLTLQTLAQAAFKPGIRLYAVVRWMPRTGDLVKAIEVLSDDWGDKDVRAATYALRRLHGLISQRAGGRPHGWRAGRSLPGEKLIDWYREASEDYADEMAAPTLRDLAQELRVKSPTTAKRRWKETTGLPWPPPSTLLDEPDESVI